MLMLKIQIFEMAKKIVKKVVEKITCVYCNSPDIVRDAWTVYNKDTQSWEISQLFTQYYCKLCRKYGYLNHLNHKKEK